VADDLTGDADGRHVQERPDRGHALVIDKAGYAVVDVADGGLGESTHLVTRADTAEAALKVPAGSGGQDAQDRLGKTIATLFVDEAAEYFVAGAVATDAQDPGSAALEGGAG